MDGPYYTLLVTDIKGGTNSKGEYVIYIATFGGLYKTYDYGETYEKIINISCTSVDCFQGNSDILYFSVYDIYTTSSTLYKSTNGGESYYAVQNGITNNRIIKSICISPFNQDITFIGFENSGTNKTLYRTTNGGSSWTEVNYVSSSSHKGIDEIIFSVSNSNYLMIIAGNTASCSHDGVGFYFSSDMGDTWDKRTKGLHNCKLHSMTIESDGLSRDENIYVGTETIYSTGGIYRSSDYGNNWSQVFQNPYNVIIRGLSSYENTIYAALDECGAWVGLIKSYDGFNWVNVNNGMLCPSTRRVKVINNQTVLTGGYNTVYLTTNSGTNFIEKTRGLEKTNCFSVAGLNDFIITSNGSQEPRFSVSSDGGSTWTSTYNDCSFMIGTGIDIDQTDQSYIHSCQREADYFTYYILRSTNGGLNWTKVVTVKYEENIVLNKLSDIKIDPNNTMRIFCVGNDNPAPVVYTSNNRGFSYQSTHVKNIYGQNHGFDLQCVEIDPNVTEKGYSKFVYIGGKPTLNTARLYRKDNWDDNEWNDNYLYNQGLPATLEINQIAVQPASELQEDYFIYLATSSGVYRKNSNSDIWYSSSQGLNHTNIITIAINPVNPNIVFLAADGSNSDHIYYSTNYGSSWNEIQIMTTINVNRLRYSYSNGFLFPPRLFAATTNGLYEITISDTDADKGELVNAIRNFPNPFNSITTISFSLKNNSYVEIKLYDVTGKLIKTLLSSTLREGNHSINFNFNNYSSGIYFYTININNNFLTSRKLILIK
ncbi:MAG: T9SS type A sorting domain-containing protein [Ignavibacteria bacterium]|nr:T9SS type A sorting domain-containing protein [Ignavibacteria bacterium]